MISFSPKLCTYCRKAPAAPILRPSRFNDGSGFAGVCDGCRKKKAATHRAWYIKRNRNKLGRIMGFGRTLGPCSCRAKVWKRGKDKSGRQRVQCSKCRQTWIPNGRLFGVSIDIVGLGVELRGADYDRYLQIRKMRGE